MRGAGCERFVWSAIGHQTEYTCQQMQGVQAVLSSSPFNTQEIAVRQQIMVKGISRLYGEHSGVVPLPKEGDQAPIAPTLVDGSIMIHPNNARTAQRGRNGTNADLTRQQ